MRAEDVDELRRRVVWLSRESSSAAPLRFQLCARRWASVGGTYAFVRVDYVSLELLSARPPYRQAGVWESSIPPSSAARSALEEVFGDDAEIRTLPGCGRREALVLRASCSGEELADELEHVRVALRRRSPVEERVRVVGAIGVEALPWAWYARQMASPDADGDSVYVLPATLAPELVSPSSFKRAGAEGALAGMLEKEDVIVVRAGVPALLPIAEETADPDLALWALHDEAYRAIREIAGERGSAFFVDDDELLAFCPSDVRNEVDRRIRDAAPQLLEKEIAHWAGHSATSMEFPELGGKLNLQAATVHGTRGCSAEDLLMAVQDAFSQLVSKSQ